MPYEVAISGYDIRLRGYIKIRRRQHDLAVGVWPDISMKAVIFPCLRALRKT